MEQVQGVAGGYEARTPEELDEAMSKAFLKITAKDAFGYFTACGYNII